MQTLRLNNAAGANDTDIYIKIDRIGNIDKTSTGAVTVMELTDGFNNMVPIGAQDQLADNSSNYAIVGQLQTLPKTILDLKSFANSNSLNMYFISNHVGTSQLRIAGILIRPATLTFGTTTSTSIVTNWTSGDADGITYTLEMGTASDYSNAVAIYTGPLLTFTKTGLTTGTTYYFRIKVSAPGFGTSIYKTALHATS